MSHHTQFVNQFALRCIALATLSSILFPLSAAPNCRPQRKPAFLEGNEHIICPLGDGHLLLQVILCAVFIQCRRNLCESLPAHPVQSFLPYPVLPFPQPPEEGCRWKLCTNCCHFSSLIVDMLYSIMKKAKQQGYHIAIGIHPVCATATALFSFHAVSPSYTAGRSLFFFSGALLLFPDSPASPPVACCSV